MVGPAETGRDGHGDAAGMATRTPAPVAERVQPEKVRNSRLADALIWSPGRERSGTPPHVPDGKTLIMGAETSLC